MTRRDCREDYAVEAAQDGRHAARTGRPRSDNPHTIGSVEWARWEDSYSGVEWVTRQNRALGRIIKPLAAK